MAQLNWSVLPSSFLSKLSSSKNSKQTMKTPRIDCDSEQSNRKHQNTTNTNYGWESPFIRPHGGRQMILPVDSAQERCLVTVFPTSLSPRVLQAHTADSLSENLKNKQWRLCGRWRSDAQVSDKNTQKTKRKICSVGPYCRHTTLAVSAVLKTYLCKFC